MPATFGGMTWRPITRMGDCRDRSMRRGSAREGRARRLRLQDPVGNHTFPADEVNFNEGERISI
jgi:hypothetical protein